MKEVSCRHFSYWFQLLEKNGRSIERSIARLPYSREYLLEPGNRLDWSEYVVFCEDAVDELGGVEGVRKIPQLYGDTREMGYIRKIVGLFASPRKVYEFIILKHGKSLYTHLDFALIDLPDGRLQIRIRIPEEYEDSPVWFWGSEPSFASMTQLIGLPPAKIETVVQPRLGIYTLELPKSQTILSHFLRVGRGLLAPLGFLQIVDTQQAELRRLVKDIEVERDNLTHLISSLPDGMVILEDNRVRFSNAALRNMMEIGEENDWRDTTADQLPVPLARARPGVRRRLASGKMIEVVSRSAITFQARAAELVIVRDVSDLQKIEDRIAQAASREREKLAQDLHDGLGQYFAALNFKASALSRRDSPTPESLDEIAGLAREAASLSREIVYDLGTSHAVGGDMVAALRKLCLRMNHIFRSHFTFSSEIPSATVDPAVGGELFFLIKEILTNAAKHADADGVALEVRQVAPGWQIAVSDDGCGFSPVAVGAGLGLETMRLRAGRLGGEIAIHSKPGHGTQILIDLPGHVLQPVELSRESALASPVGSAEAPGATRRVFLLDDHAIVREGVRRLIEDQPGLVFCGETDQADDLVDRLRAAQADILVADLFLHEGTSHQAVAVVRRAIPGLTIVVLTMFDGEIHRQRAREAGADDFVHKSDSPEHLLEALLHGSSRRTTARRGLPAGAKNETSTNFPRDNVADCDGVEKKE